MRIEFRNDNDDYLDTWGYLSGDALQVPRRGDSVMIKNKSYIVNAVMWFSLDEATCHVG